MKTMVVFSQIGFPPKNILSPCVDVISFYGLHVLIFTAHNLLNIFIFIIHCVGNEIMYHMSLKMKSKN